MAETKEEIAAERDALRAENENLRGQLAAAGVRRTVPQHTFMLTEGQRQELEATGLTVVGGREVTIAEVREMLPESQSNVVIEDPRHPQRPLPVARREAVRGVDFIYPSVAPRQIDPEVAGTPGISGPAAGTVPAVTTVTE